MEEDLSSSLPLFASAELAARVESAERRLIADSVEAARLEADDRVLTLELAGGLAAWARPGSPLNKVVGVGFGGEIPLSQLEAVEQAMASRDAPVQVELSSLAEPSIAPFLSRRGYVLQGFENVLGLPLPTAPAVPVPGVEVVVAAMDDPRWIEAVVTGFAHPDTQGVPSSESFPREALEPIFRDMASAAGHCNLIALADGELAGGGSMRIVDNVVILCGAATLPVHRRRGVQSALLDVRLAMAAEAGCDLAVVTTQPGSKSQQNVQKKGFHLLYNRAILVREA